MIEKNTKKKKKLTEWPKRRDSRRLGHYRVAGGGTGVAGGGCGGCGTCGTVPAVLRCCGRRIWRDGGRDGRVRRWGREELMMWQFVIVYKYVCKLCKRARHAGTPKIIKNIIF